MAWHGAQVVTVEDDTPDVDVSTLTDGVDATDDDGLGMLVGMVVLD